MEMNGGDLLLRLDLRGQALKAPTSEVRNSGEPTSEAPTSEKPTSATLVSGTQT